MSELRENVTAEQFRIAYESFVEQADKNAISRKANGSKTPLGYKGHNEFDGATFSQKFGEGGASSTPYMNWWVVSIYYLPSNGTIVLGIEEDRYPHLGKMNPEKHVHLGNRGSRIAVFFATNKESVDYSKLYEMFINVSEEVMKLGLR